MRKSKRQKRKHAQLRKILSAIGTGLAVIIAVAVFYLAVIIGQPNEETLLNVNPDVEKGQPLQAQLPQTVSSEAEIDALLDTFPAPLMRFPADLDITLVSALAYDIAYQGAFARMAEITYQTNEGAQVTLQSLYPREAFSLIGNKGYTLSPTIGYQMLHMNCVRMDSANFIRFHVQGDEALYIITLPHSLNDMAAGVIKQTQLAIPLS